MIFRGDKKLLWMVDEEKKTYTEMTEEGAKAMGAQMDDAMTQMQDALKKVPPEQRAMMEKMLAGKISKASAGKRTFKPMEEKRRINGFDCAGYLVSKEGGPITEVWTADPKSIQLDPKELAVFKEVAEFMKSMTSGMDQIQELVKDYEHPAEGDVPGFPVLTIQRNEKGKELWRTELVRVDKGAVAETTFEVPSGFEMQKPPGVK
jgi:hypothetical protein